MTVSVANMSKYAAVTETLGMAGRQKENCWHGTERRSTMSIASTDIKKAFVVARQKHISNIVGDIKSPWMEYSGLIT